MGRVKSAGGHGAEDRVEHGYLVPGRDQDHPAFPVQRVTLLRRNQTESLRQPGCTIRGARDANSAKCGAEPDGQCGRLDTGPSGPGPVDDAPDARRSRVSHAHPPATSHQPPPTSHEARGTPADRQIEVVAIFQNRPPGPIIVIGGELVDTAPLTGIDRLP